MTEKNARNNRISFRCRQEENHEKLPTEDDSNEQHGIKRHGFISLILLHLSFSANLALLVSFKRKLFIFYPQRRKLRKSRLWFFESETGLGMEFGMKNC